VADDAKETPQARWARRNRDKMRAASRRWRARHPAKQKAATYRWRERNRQVWNAYQRFWRLAAGREWLRKHPEYAREKSRRQRAQQPEKIRAYMRAWMKRWYATHFLEARAKNRQRRAADPEKWRAYGRALYRLYRTKYPERYARMLASGRAWAKRNRPKLAHWAGRYRARKAGAIGSHTFAQWMSCVEIHAWKCAYCDVALTPTTLTKDHVVPLFKGGTNYVENLAPACKSCNSAKRDRTDFRPPKGAVDRPFGAGT
jgi:5-methylcytosine-specific restriction endonuclease McrA